MPLKPVSLLSTSTTVQLYIPPNQLHKYGKEQAYLGSDLWGKKIVCLQLFEGGVTLLCASRVQNQEAGRNLSLLLERALLPYCPARAEGHTQ